MNDTQAAFEHLAVGHLATVGSGRRRMFGRDCLTHDGHNVAFLDAGRLALKLPPAVAAELLTSGQAVVPQMGRRAMRRWVSVALPAAATGRASRCEELLARARTYALTG